MSIGVELPRVDAFIASRLRADPTITQLAGDRVHADVVPQGGALPAIVFQLQAPSPDTLAVGADRVMSRPVYLVKAIEKTGSWQGAVKTLADRIDRVLHRASGTAGDGTVIGCVRLEPFRMLEMDDGDQYRHLGALFRVWVSVS